MNRLQLVFFNVLVVLTAAWAIAAAGLASTNLSAASHSAGYSWFILALQQLLTAATGLSYRLPQLRVPACLFLGMLVTNLWLLIDDGARRAWFTGPAGAVQQGPATSLFTAACIVLVLGDVGVIVLLLVFKVQHDNHSAHSVAGRQGYQALAKHSMQVVDAEEGQANQMEQGSMQVCEIAGQLSENPRGTEGKVTSRAPEGPLQQELALRDLAQVADIDVDERVREAIRTLMSDSPQSPGNGSSWTDPGDAVSRSNLTVQLSCERMYSLPLGIPDSPCASNTSHQAAECTGADRGFTVMPSTLSHVTLTPLTLSRRDTYGEDGARQPTWSTLSCEAGVQHKQRSALKHAEQLHTSAKHEDDSLIPPTRGRQALSAQLLEQIRLAVATQVHKGPVGPNPGALLDTGGSASTSSSLTSTWAFRGSQQGPLQGPSRGSRSSLDASRSPPGSLHSTRGETAGLADRAPSQTGPWTRVESQASRALSASMRNVRKMLAADFTPLSPRKAKIATQLLRHSSGASSFFTDHEEALSRSGSTAAPDAVSMQPISTNTQHMDAAALVPAANRQHAAAHSAAQAPRAFGRSGSHNPSRFSKLQDAVETDRRTVGHEGMLGDDVGFSSRAGAVEVVVDPREQQAVLLAGALAASGWGYDPELQ